MAKKEKKPKKEKAKKEKKKKEPDLPYAGSEGMKRFLMNTLIVLCVLFLFIAMYTIRYCMQGNITIPRNPAAAAAAAAQSAGGSGSASGAKSISYGTIWFSMPDGTFMQGES